MISDDKPYRLIWKSGAESKPLIRETNNLEGARFALIMLYLDDQQQHVDDVVATRGYGWLERADHQGWHAFAHAAAGFENDKEVELFEKSAGWHVVEIEKGFVLRNEEGKILVDAGTHHTRGATAEFGLKLLEHIQKNSPDFSLSLPEKS